MAVRAGKREVVYDLPEALTLDDIRQIVRETETLAGDAQVRLPRDIGQRDAEHIKFVITENWPPKAT